MKTHISFIRAMSLCTPHLFAFIIICLLSGFIANDAKASYSYQYPQSSYNPACAENLAVTEYGGARAAAEVAAKNCYEYVIYGGIYWTTTHTVTNVALLSTSYVWSN